MFCILVCNWFSLLRFFLLVLMLNLIRCVFWSVGQLNLKTMIQKEGDEGTVFDLS